MNGLPLRDLLLRCAADEGFPLAGALDIDRAFAESDLPEHIARYDRWLAAGMAGAMSYLERGRERRADPRMVFPEARSILCVAIPYPRRAAGATIDQGPRYARYLQCPDYHEDLASRLERAMQAAAKQWNGPALTWKACVDTSAVLERSWAALAGLGWIGKNTMLIHPRLGSYLFLGEVLLNQSVNYGPTPLPDYCGHCDRCMKACPPGALAAPRVLDSRQCISYWTLEKRGALPIDEKQKRAVGNWIGGCDVCQEVCPFNLKPSKIAEPPPPPNATDLHDWRALLAETQEQYRARVSESAMNRIKPQQFSRNLALALANAILETPAADRDAHWVHLREPVERRWATESDESARAEWSRCFELFGHSPKRNP